MTALQWAIGICIACVLVCGIEMAATIRAGRRVNAALRRIIGGKGGR